MTDAPTVLFVGAGRHQRRALRRVKELGAAVVAVDRNPDAPGLSEADVGEVADFGNVEAVAEVGRRHGVGGVMTFAADRAVPVVAGVAERLALPGIGTQTAHLMTNKIAMRRRLADAGLPQPRFAAIRHVREVRAAADTVGFPAVLKPADSAGQRGLFLVASSDDVERHLHASLAQSTDEEAILESYHPGLEVNGLLVARDGEVTVVTLSDRRRPPGPGFGVAVAHVYPSTLYGDALAEVERVGRSTVHALGLRDGIAYPQVIWGDDGVARLIDSLKTSSISRSRATGTPGATSRTTRVIVGASVARGDAVLTTTCTVVGENERKLVIVSVVICSMSTYASAPTG